MINRQTKLLLALLSTMVWLQGHTVEGVYRFEFRREEIIVPSTNADSAAATADGSTRRRTTTTADSITTDESETTTECELCSPGDLIKTKECYLEGMKQLDPELQEPGFLEDRIKELRDLNDEVCHDRSGRDLPWGLSADSISIKWDKINRETFDFDRYWNHKETLGNGVSTHTMKCSDDDGPNAFSSSSSSALRDDEEGQNERSLQSCNPHICHTQGMMLDVECYGCYRRRRNLRQLSTTQVDIKKMQLAVNAMYNVCLLKDIPCMVCSSARLCVFNDDGDKLCAEPSCHSDAEGCPESI